MPINMNDPRVRAEKSPQAIVDLGTRLRHAYGVGPDAFGVKGNEFHSYGFHRSRNWIFFSPDSRYGTDDYSVQGTRNHGGDPDNVCAFDFTPATWGTADNTAKMITITRRLYDAAKRNDPRLRNWYEFAGTLDGRNVVTFYAHGGDMKTPFDPSHLHHVHGSKYRDNAEDDDTGLGDVMLGIGVSEEEDDMGASFGPIEIKIEGTTSLTIPPVEAGLADPRPAWLNLCNDTFGITYGLRVWYTTGNEVWNPLPGTNGGLLTLRSGQRFSQEIPRGAACLSITRKAIDDQGTPVEPSDKLKPYNGHLTCCIERGAIKSS